MMTPVSPWDVRDSAWDTLAYFGPRPLDVLDQAICPTCRFKGTEATLLEGVFLSGFREEELMAWCIGPCDCYVSSETWELRSWPSATGHPFATWHRKGC
jgi:hypothetical protein